jgi:hypothetical protein
MFSMIHMSVWSFVFDDHLSVCDSVFDDPPVRMRPVHGVTPSYYFLVASCCGVRFSTASLPALHQAWSATSNSSLCQLVGTTGTGLASRYTSEYSVDVILRLIFNMFIMIIVVSKSREHIHIVMIFLLYISGLNYSWFSNKNYYIHYKIVCIAYISFYLS